MFGSKSNNGMRRMKEFRGVLMIVAICGIFSNSSLATRSWSYQSTGCRCDSALVGTLTSADIPQTQEEQDIRWEIFKWSSSGLVDADRIGNATCIYNCHAYAYNIFSKWLEDDQLYCFQGNTSGCWQADDSGTIKSDAYHSCLVANNEGKCGQEFLCKNNQCVYGYLLPTQKYKKN